MSRVHTTALLLAACVVVPTLVRAQGLTIQSDTGSVIVTSGSGEVSLAPDRATIRLRVETRASSAAQASRDNSIAVRRVLDSLNASRMPDESLLVVAVSVRTNENSQSGTLNGYSAAATIRVMLHSLDRLGTVLDRALGAGATGVQDIEFMSDHEDAARLDALAQAYRKAQADAQALAQAAGVRLGPLLRLSSGPQYGPVYGAVRDYNGDYESVPISASDVRVAAVVQATWRVVR